MRAKIVEHERDFAYKVYVTDSLQLMAQSKYFTTRWADIVKSDDIDSRSADEIATDIIKRAGLTLKGSDEAG